MILLTSGANDEEVENLGERFGTHQAKCSFHAQWSTPQGPVRKSY